MTAQLVIDAFNRARRRGLIEKGAIIHTDRGSQYASIEYRRLVYINGFRKSMSGKRNCYDNAPAESFFSRFKAELVEGGIFESVDDARSEIRRVHRRLLQSRLKAFKFGLFESAGI